MANNENSLTNLLAAGNQYQQLTPEGDEARQQRQEAVRNLANPEGHVMMTREIVRTALDEMNDDRNLQLEQSRLNQRQSRPQAGTAAQVNDGTETNNHQRLHYIPTSLQMRVRL